MPPKTAATKAAAIRLPPLPKLRVRRPNQREANPCLGIMSTLLSCWASAGYNLEGCRAIETSLRTCMDTPQPKNQKKNDINHHLTRMYPKMVGPRKRK